MLFLGGGLRKAAPLLGIESLNVLYFPNSEATPIRGSQRLPMTPEVAVDTCKVRGLLGAVRDKVLIWALDLAEAGIHGEGMTFTAQERELW